MPEAAGQATGTVLGDAAYEVTAVRYGTLAANKGEMFHRFETYGEADGPVELAYYFWVARAADRIVLVDTGFDPVAAARRGRDCLVPPLEALSSLGVAPEDVSAVVVTHFHYDHIGNLAAFPGAELILPRRELEFWTGPLARHAQFAAHVEAAEVEWIRRAAEEGRVRTSAGEEQVLPGITVIEVGGHSPGQQLVLVEGEEGRVLLTSDAVHFYEELELHRPFGVIADLEAMYRAYERVEELSREPGTVVVAGHDPAVMQRFTGAGACAEIAVQIDGNDAA
jgi:glyoxylase-like metal-dependent hydrolase (beta-lactamase superfamily II)